MFGGSRGVSRPEVTGKFRGPHCLMLVSEVISSNAGDRPCDKGAPEALKRGLLWGEGESGQRWGCMTHSRQEGNRLVLALRPVLVIKPRTAEFL